MGLFERLFGKRGQRARLQPLYDAVVATARDRHWYVEGAVPDTIDGRFDMIAAVLTLVLIRIGEEEDREAPTLLAELFIDDMDGSLRQLGIGDLMVGKHVGKMMGALGGRLSAFREALVAGGSLDAVVRRNIFHDSPPSSEALAFVASRLTAFHQRMTAMTGRAIAQGELPPL